MVLCGHGFQVDGLGLVMEVVEAVGRVTPCAPRLEKLDDGAHGVTRPTVRFMGGCGRGGFAARQFWGHGLD